MCRVQFEEKDSWREDRKKERERKRKLRGGAAVTEEQRSRGRKGKKRQIQVSVVDQACWAGYVDPPLVWEREKKKRRV